MKKIILILITCLLFTGCSRVVEDLDDAKKELGINTENIEKTKENLDTEKNPYERTMEEFDIKYLAKDVEYNIPNKLGTIFLIEGLAELSNYYNYGYDSEETFFCVRIHPLFDTAKETWYLYFDRGLNEDLYKTLVDKGKIQLLATGILSEDFYEEGQNCQAFGLVSIYE